MKSTSKGIYSKLKDSLVPWDEKLSLARSAWDSADCVIPNKQQVLLDWIIQGLISASKNRADCQVFHGLWKLLLHALQSKQLVSQSRIPVTLKPQLLQVFTDIFLHKEPASEDSSIDVVINCCYTVVSNPQLSSPLLAIFETYVTFLSSLLSFFVPICSDQSKELHLLVETCLEKYLLIQRQQANQRKVFAAICQRLLGPFANLRHVLKAAQKGSQLDNWWTKKRKNVSQLMELALARSLFHKGHMSEYHQALKVAREDKQRESDEPASKKPRISTYTKLLFDKLWEMSSDSATEVNKPETKKDVTKEAVLSILPFLYKEFIISTRKANPSPSTVEFNFFTEICEIMGVLNDRCKDVSSVCTLLHQLLECILLHDVYQVADDSSNGSLQFSWFKNLAEVLIHTSEPGEAVFQCLEVLIKLNHSLLEPHLETVWMMLWKAGPIAGVPHNSLMSSLISTYVKLRQFEKLVAAILVSLRTLDFSPFGLTTLFKQRFTKAIQGLPFGQIASIWNIFCEEIKDNYLNKLLSSNEHVVIKKPHKKKAPSPVVVIWRNLEYVMSIFNAFLVNISFGGVGEQLRRKSSVLTIEKLLRHTVKDVLEPLIEVASREVHQTDRESACFSTLLLQYTLGELELFLKKLKLVEEEGAEILLPSVVWSEEIRDFVPTKFKEMAFISRDRARLWYLKNALCIQNIRFVQLRKTELEQEPEDCELHKLASCVCSGVTEDAVCSASWDRQEVSINKENAPVALWDLIGRHAVVLLPLCTAEQQLTLAQPLIKTVAKEAQENGKPKQGCITMSDVSMAMIQSTAFHEMLAMQTCSVCALWGHLKQSIDFECVIGLREKLSKVLYKIATPKSSTVVDNSQAARVLQKTSESDATMDDYKEEDVDDELSAEESSEEDSDGDEDLEKETQTSDEQFVGSEFKAISCELTGVAESVLCSKAPVANISAVECHNLLKVLGYLPLDWLSDDSHARCLIGLFTCDVLFNSAIMKECSPDLLKPLLLSRQLLAVMFDGCISRKRFIAHHVIDLEAVHAWLVGSATKLWQNYNAKQNTASGMYAMLSVTRGLLFSTFKYLLKAPSYTTNAGQSIVEKLQEGLQACTLQVQQCSKHSLKETVSSCHAVFTIVEGILAVCEEVVTSKTSSSKMIRISSDVVIELGPKLLELLRTIVRESQRKRKGKRDEDVGEETESRWHDVLLQFPVLIDSFTSLLHIYSVSKQSRKLLRVNKEYKQYDWQDVFDVMLTAVIHHLFERNTNAPLPINEGGTIHSCLHFLKIVCLSCSKLDLRLPDDFHTRLLASALNFLRLIELNKNKSTEGHEIDEQQSVELNSRNESEMLETMTEDQAKGSGNEVIAEEGYSLVASLLKGCDPVLLPELLEGLCGEITSKSMSEESVDRLGVSLHVWLRLLSGRFTKDRKKELRPKLPKVLFALQFLLQELKSGNLRIVLLVIDIMVKILSLGKGMLLPHNALLVLHSCLMIKVSARDKSFPMLFESQYSLLSTLLFQHSEAVYGAVHVFITCVRNLLLSLIQSCDEQNESTLGKDGIQKKTASFKPTELTQSAQRMARLYQEISSHKNTFSKYSPYMIADYIHGVQTVAIPPIIRDSLVPGVYCLLDMCGEHELSLMHAVVERGSRELFHSLHADYTKYHKFKGKV